MKNGKNIWYCIEADTKIYSKEEPQSDELSYIAAYAEYRILSNNRYIPYTGNSVWEKSANKAMAKRCQ